MPKFISSILNFMSMGQKCRDPVSALQRSGWKIYFAVGVGS
jgi:hypothetical protein